MSARLALCALAVAVLPVASAGASAALPRVDSTLPSWLAHGGAATVSGWTGAAEQVRLVTDHGSTLGRATSGPLGRFTISFRAPLPGRYRLHVAAAEGTARAGSLLVRPLVLAAVGDVTFGEQVGGAIQRFGAAYPWRGVAGTLRRADITIGNLETAVSNGGSAVPDKQYHFRGLPSDLLPVAGFAGFDVLTLANNHTGDFGTGALLDTLAAVRAAGIVPIGAGADSAAAAQPALLHAGGLTVAVLGRSDVNPLGFAATATAPGTSRADPLALARDVSAARRRADVVVCFFHWGIEGRTAPTPRQQELANACLGAGAQVVVGAHPHVFGAVTAPRPHTVVAWTLGNFVFPSAGVTARTGILEVELGRSGVTGYRVVPVEIDGFSPRLLHG